MAKNKWCLKCISFLLRDDLDVPDCYGVEPLTAETEGCMHCYRPTTGNKTKDEILLVESNICGADGRIKDALFTKKELDTKLNKLKYKLKAVQRVGGLRII